jgi:heme-degrading monooxygenase HmoA
VKVFELARIQIKPMADEEVADRVTYALELIRLAPGCGQVQIWRGIEDDQTVLMLVEWDSLQDHLTFRESGALADDRKRFEPILAGPSAVQHFNELVVLPRR